MRKLGILLIAILVVLVVLAAVVPPLLDVNKYRPRIQAELEQRLNRNVSLGDMHASLFPPSFRVKNVVIGEDKQFATGRPFAFTDELRVSVQLLPLLKGDVEIRSLTLNRPQVELVRNPAGVWNFASLGNRTVTGATTPPKPSTTPASQQPQEQKKFSLASLEINDGQVAITDMQKHMSRAVYDHIDLDLSNYVPGEKFQIALTAHLPGEGKQVAKLEGRGGPIDDASLVSTPFDGDFTLDQVSLSGVQKFLNSEALANMNATVTGKASVKNESGRLASKGSLKIENAVVRGNALGYPVQMDYDLADDLNSDIIQIARADLKLGNTPLSISGSVNSKTTPALLDVRAKASDVSIAEVAHLASVFGVAFNPNMQFAGRVNADLHAQGTTENPVLDGSLGARDINVTGKDLPQPVRIPAIQLALAPDAIHSNEFTASTGGTTVTGRFDLMQYASKSPTINTTLRTANSELGEVLNIAHSMGIAALEDVNGRGRFSLNVTATGPIKNTEAMAFNGTGALANATIQSKAITQPLQIHNANIKFAQNGATISDFSGSLGSTNARGNISVRNFNAPNIQLTLDADKIDALEWQKLIAPTPQQKASLSIVPAAEAAPRPVEPSVLTRATGGGTINIGALSYDQLVFNNVRSTLTLDHGVIRLSPVNALVAGGQANGTITVDTRGPENRFAMQMNVQRADANKLLSSVSKVRDTLFGLLASNMQAQFRSVPTGQDIASTLNGRINLNLSDGKLAGVDLLQQLSSIGGFQSLGRAATGFTQLQKVTGTFDVQNGVAVTHDLRATVDGGNLAADGALSFVDNSINMHVMAVLAKDYSQQVGGTQIGGFMRTALANNRGELVIPVIITGTMQSPKVSPDLQKVAEMKVQNLLPTLANPGSLMGIFGGKQGGTQPGQQSGIGAIFGALGGNQSSNQQQQQQQPPQQQQPQAQQQQQQDDWGGAISGAVGALLGGKKKQQQPQQQQQQQQKQPPQ